MTHYEINFSDMPEQERKDKALDELVLFWGADKYASVVNMMRKMDKIPFQAFAITMSMTGVEGYPVKVLYESVWGKE
jgi:hypothetical protein